MGAESSNASDTRWCSDGFEFRFEFRCETERDLFALACWRSEAIGWVASPTGYSGDDIRDLILKAWRSVLASTADHTNG
jgi:putative transposase